MSEILPFQEAFNALKSATMILGFKKVDSYDPSTQSYIGGRPYITSDENWPLCTSCGRKMDFLMQMNEKKQDDYHVLSVFYTCDCLMADNVPNIQFINYFDPSEANIDQTKAQNGTSHSSEKHELAFIPKWSMPNWSLLPHYDPELCRKILNHFDDTETAADYYHNLLERAYMDRSMLYSSLYGYPEFMGNPKLFTCDCCGRELEFYFQLSSTQMIDVDFNDAILFSYRCPKTNTYYFFLSY